MNKNYLKYMLFCLIVFSISFYSINDLQASAENSSGATAEGFSRVIYLLRQGEEGTNLGEKIYYTKKNGKYLLKFNTNISGGRALCELLCDATCDYSSKLGLADCKVSDITDSVSVYDASRNVITTDNVKPYSVEFFQQNNILHKNLCSNPQTLVCQYKLWRDKGAYDAAHYVTYAVTNNTGGIQNVFLGKSRTNGTPVNIDSDNTYIDNLKYVDSDGNINYKCPEKINWSSSLYGLKLSFQSFDFPEGNNSSLVGTCSSFVSVTQDIAVKSCGVYGMINLSVYKDEDKKWNYDATSSDGTNVKQGEHYSLKGIDSTTGCPAEVCYAYLSEYENLNSTRKQCYGKVEEILSGDEVEEEKEKNDSKHFFDNWSSIPADIGVAIGINSCKNEQGESIDCTVTCEGMLGTAIDYIKLAFNIIKIASAIILTVLTATDFVKAIAANDEGALKKSGSRLAKRAVIVVVIFILPSIINLVLRIIGMSNGTCGIG